jgi:hypothetical protein
MKTIYLIAAILFSLSVQAQESLKGAYQSKEDKEVIICLIDGYFVESKYNLNTKAFNFTWGGPFVKEGNKLLITIHFDSRDKAAVGTTKEISFGEKYQILIDKGENVLAGNWRMSGRKNGDQFTETPLRARRTYKLLTGTRFQWMAINIDTGEFAGTGGGTYSFINGKYTENIEFFSRDSSRVGASLNFIGKIENGQWHHSGLSSKGDPIYEIWTKN